VIKDGKNIENAYNIM